MKDLTVAQSFMLCALNEKGGLPVTSAETPVCLMAGGLVDLMLESCVDVRDKKIHVTAPLAGDLHCLQSLYEFISEKGPVKLEKLASDYCFTFSGKRIHALTNDIGSALAGQHCVAPGQGGLLGKKDVFIPDRSAVDSVVQHIRAEILEDGDLSDEMVALAGLLEKSGLLKRYFSRYEKDILKERLKEIRKSLSNQIVREMLDYVDTVMMTIIIAST